jgi:hypothetical protein
MRPNAVAAPHPSNPLRGNTPFGGESVPIFPQPVPKRARFYRRFYKTPFFHVFLRFFALRLKQNRNSTP